MARSKPDSSRKPTPRAVDYRRLAMRLNLVATPTRLRVLMLLGDGERNVGDLAEALGWSGPATSHNLARPKRTGVVAARRDGKWVDYSRTEAGRVVVRTVGEIGSRYKGGTAPARD